MTRAALFKALRAAALVAAIGGALWGGSKLIMAFAKPTLKVPTLTVQRAKLTREVVAEGTLRAVKSTPVAATEGGRRGQLKIVWLAEDGIAVKKGDLLIRFDEAEFVAALAKEQSQRVSADARIAKEKAQGNLAVNNRVRAAEQASDEGELAQRFKSDDPAIFSKNQMLEAQIDLKLSSARVEHAANAQEIQRRLANERVGLLAADKKRAQIEIDRAQKALAGLVVTAPHDGFFIVTRNEWGTPVRLGDLVWRAQPVGEVARLEDIEAQVFVLEADASGLQPNRKARVNLEGDTSRSFEATVRHVGTLAKRRDPRVPVQYFEATLSLDTTDARLMKPGKRVRATLNLGDDTGLVIPRQAVFQKDERAVVYVGQERFEAVPVKLGTGTPGRVLVTDGLHEGDTIALQDPTAPVVSESASGTSRAGPTTPASSSTR